MSMDGRVVYLLNIAAKLYAKHGCPPTPFQFAKALGIHLLAADIDSATPGPPAVITYSTRYISKRRFPLWHEIAHIIAAWFGLERELEEEMGPERAAPRIEDIADLIAGLFAITPALVNLAVRRYGVGTAAVLFLAEKAQVHVIVAARRLVFHDLTASRAAAIIAGSHVFDLVTQNYTLPFEGNRRIPEAHLSLPHADLHLLRKSRVLAVWEG